MYAGNANGKSGFQSDIGFVAYDQFHYNNFETMFYTCKVDPFNCDIYLQPGINIF